MMDTLPSPKSQGPGSAESRVQLRCPLAAGGERREHQRLAKKWAVQPYAFNGISRGSKGI